MDYLMRGEQKQLEVWSKSLAWNIDFRDILRLKASLFSFNITRLKLEMREFSWVNRNFYFMNYMLPFCSNNEQVKQIKLKYLSLQVLQHKVDLPR